MRPYAKKFDSRERVFFISAQALEATSKNALNYNERSSGWIIYSYAGGNAISMIDPNGKLFGVDDATIGPVVTGVAIVGGGSAFVGTLIGGGSLGQAFASIPREMLIKAASSTRPNWRRPEFHNAA